MNISEVVVPLKGNLTSIGPQVDSGVDFGFLIPLLAVGFSALGLVLLFYLSSSFKKYRRFVGFLKAIRATATYAAYGALTLVVIVVPAIVLHWTFTSAASNPGPFMEVLKWIGVGAGIYAVCVVVGYVTKKRVWLRLRDFNKKLNEEPESDVVRGKKSNVI